MHLIMHGELQTLQIPSPRTLQRALGCGVGLRVWVRGLV